MRITLQVGGHEKLFSEEELTVIVNKHFAREDAGRELEMVESPTEGKWFRVYPLAIDQKLFQEKREDQRQERTRQLILEAFTELKRNPKYGRVFETMRLVRPCKEMEMTIAELKEFASYFGGQNANWVEQALEWAYRISNGESWEAVCNYADTANCYRLVIWKTGSMLRIGGAHDHGINPASFVCDEDLYDNDRIDHAMPLIVRYRQLSTI